MKKYIHTQLTDRDNQNMERLHLSTAEYVRRKKAQKRLGGVATVLAPVAVIAGLAYNAVRSDNQAAGNYDKIEEEALAKTKNAWSDVVVFHEGVKFRTAPHTVNSDASQGPTTEAGQVGKGEVLRVDRPLVYTEDDGTFWLGFAEQGDVGSKKTSLNDRVFWVNMTEIEKQNNNGKYFTTYDYPPGSVDASPDGLYAVTINTKGDVLGDNHGHGGPVGVPSTMTEAEFTKMAVTEGLTLGGGK